nr:MAG: capsid protein [Chemarfal virus 237]
MGSIGGGALGSMIGAGGAGSEVGNGLGALVSRWLGQGDYTVSANSLVSRAKASGSIPNMHKDGQSIIVRHKEYLTEIRGATSFTVRNEFDINPGLSTTFPWLSAIAAQYSQYRVRGMIYHYVPTSGNAVSSTNAALGSVMLQTSYRATESAPINKIELLNEYWSTECKPSEPFCHPIECDPKENPFNVQYVRTGDLPTTENQLMYDLGRTTVAVSGQQANDIVLGDLWITYEIELKKPVLTNATNTSIQAMSMISTTAVGSGNPLGAVNTQTVTFDSFEGTFEFLPNTIFFPRGAVGCYQISCFYSNATTFVSAPSTFNNCTALGAVNGNATIGSQYTTGTGQAANIMWLTISDPAVQANAGRT